jgi:hypothetical protein
VQIIDRLESDQHAAVMDGGVRHGPETLAPRRSYGLAHAAAVVQSKNVATAAQHEIRKARTHRVSQSLAATDRRVAAIGRRYRYLYTMTGIVE